MEQEGEEERGRRRREGGMRSGEYEKERKMGEVMSDGEDKDAWGLVCS